MLSESHCNDREVQRTMTDQRTPRSYRKITLAAGALLLAAALVALWPHDIEAGSVGPDVTVIYLPNVSNYGSDNGYRAYSVGTTSCNVGDEPIWWCNDAGDPFCEVNQHPVIAQNLYRLKDGRFEQIGMSWLKHGFLSTNSFDSSCGSCQGPPHGGDQLGVGCTDAYGSSLNGNRPLGMRSEVNAASGDFPYPYTQVGTGSSIDQRMQVLETDLDPALNPGALYWVEGHYIAADDAEAANAFNNASHRRVNVSGSSFNLSLQGATIREKPAIQAWQGEDPGVEVLNIDNDGAHPVERFHVARKVSGSPGAWHYEYAVHNMNADRAARSFTVQFPSSASISAAGYHDVKHHSGEPYITTDWDLAVGASSVGWSTETFAENEDANALRWGTMFTFWFDSDQPPVGLQHTIGLFKPGTPASLTFGFEPTLIFADGFESGDTTSWTLP